MAEKKPKNIESELHKKAARPNTAPIVNKKTQQKKKKKKKKNPQADKKNLFRKIHFPVCRRILRSTYY